MASVVTSLVTKTVTAASASASSTNRVTPQGGILEGENPTVYDPKNPIILFIVQVSYGRIPDMLEDRAMESVHGRE